MKAKHQHTYIYSLMSHNLNDSFFLHQRCRRRRRHVWEKSSLLFLYTVTESKIQMSGNI